VRPTAGEYSAGSRSGYGVCRYFNGDYYEGTWSDGVRNGSGMQQCMDGSNYVGQYLDAKRDGYGVYTFHNGMPPPCSALGLQTLYHAR
jgi:hypothetical protein